MQQCVPKVLGQDKRTSADEDLPEWLVGWRRSTVMMWREEGRKGGTSNAYSD